MNSNRVVVITDASCLIIYEKIDLLYILNQIFATVITTPEIADEFGHPLPEWVVIRSVKNISFQQELSLLVDAGEASAIALAKEVNTDYLITDDLEARKVSVKLGINVVGSLGVLLRAKEMGILTSVKPYIERMRNTNFRVSAELYQAVIRRAGEE